MLLAGRIDSAVEAFCFQRRPRRCGSDGPDDGINEIEDTEATKELDHLNANPLPDFHIKRRVLPPTSLGRGATHTRNVETLVDSPAIPA